MRVDTPLGHERQIAGLWAAASEGRLAHALLFAGPAGIGKFLAAETLTAGLLCERGPGRPCRQCGACKRVAADSHPDVHIIDPLKEELETIPIKRIAPREGSEGQTLEEFLGLRAMEGGWRIVLVRESERLNEEAQNALLKTLEEPGADALLILECSRTERLLPTILSRTVQVHLEPLAHEQVVASLVAQGVEPERVHEAARIADGAIGLAQRVLDEDWLERRAVLADCLRGRVSAWEALQALDGLAGDFPGRTAAAKARNEARATLDLGVALLRDAARLEAGLPEAAVPHAAVLGDLPRSISSRERLERVLVARQDVDLNLAPDAALERMLLALAPESADRNKKP